VRWPIQFLLLGLMWGGSFMFIKVEVDAGIHPVHVALLRCVVGGATLFAILLLTRDRLPERGVWKHLAVMAVLSNTLPFVLFAYGETEVSSLLAGIINATVPLLTLMFSLALLPDERPTAQKLLGIAVGFAGVVVVLTPWEGLGAGSLLGALACLGATVCYGLSFPYLRRHLTGRPETGVAISATQVAIGGVMLLPFAFLGSLPEQTPGLEVWLSILALGALGTGVAYVLMFNIVQEAGAQTGSMITYLVPVFAVILGVAVLGEEISWHEPAGGAVILAGVAISR
jgi:drug/metabolite transporter (DMT)-like permease